MEHGFHLKLRCQEEVSSCGECRGECRREAVANIVVYTDFANALTSEDVVAVLIRAAAADAKWFRCDVE